jgi:hydroxyacylglutathione hydrolase
VTIHHLEVGSQKTNCYLLNLGAGGCFVIDPGDDSDYISDTILQHNLRPSAILLTHGHLDHTLGALDLYLNYQIPIYLHQADLFLYNRTHTTARYFLGQTIPALPPTLDIVTLQHPELTIIHTPGHTPGSVAISHDSHLFTGDSFLPEEATDLTRRYCSVSDWHTSYNSLKDILSSHTIHPGHGPESYGYSYRSPVKYNRHTSQF